MTAKITRCIILIIVGVMAITNLGGCSKKCEHTDLTELSDSATCTSNGIKKLKCNLCGEEFEEESQRKGHSYKDGVCSQCNKSWKESFDEEVGNIKGVSFSYDSAADGIKWSHSETYITANGVIPLKNPNGNIGKMTISAYSSSCTYDVILSVASDGFRISFNQTSGKEMVMELVFTNFSSVKTECRNALKNAINELNNQLQSKFGFKLS